MEISEVREIVHSLLGRHGLFERGWRFKLGRGKRVLGSCNYMKREISVSKYHIMLNPDDQVMDTIRHEVAHAIAGPFAKHGPEWQRAAISLGAKPSRTLKTSNSVPPSIIVNCGICRKVLQHRYRRIGKERIKRLYCSACGTKSTGMLEQRKTAHA